MSDALPKSPAERLAAVEETAQQIELLQKAVLDLSGHVWALDDAMRLLRHGLNEQSPAVRADYAKHAERLLAPFQPPTAT